MSNLSINEYISKIENEEYFKYLHTAAMCFSEIKRLAEEQGDLNIEQNMKFEIEAFRIHESVPLLDENYSRRFEDHIDSFNEEQIKYYQGRLKECINDQLKYRYADILLDYRGEYYRSIKKYELFNIIIPLILSISEKHDKYNEDSEYETFQLLARGVELSISFNHEEFVQTLLNLIHGRLKMIQDRGQKYRWALEGCEIIRGMLESKFQKMIDGDTTKFCIELLSNGAEAFRLENNHHIQRAFFSEKINWFKVLQYSEAEIKQVLLDIGKSFEDEAEIQQGRETKSNLVKAKFLELALKHYSNIGETEKIDQLKIRIKESYKEGESEFKEIKVEMQLPEEAVREIEMIKSYFRSMNAEAMLDEISYNVDLIPDIEKIEEETRKQKEMFIFQSLVSKAVISEGRKIFQPVDEEEDFMLSVNENYMRHLTSKLDFFILPIVDTAIEDNKLNAEIVMNRLKNWPYLLDNNANLIKVGIESYFKSDYVGSLHILVPQLEAMVRNLFSQAGYPTTSIKKGLAQYEVTFTEFLRNDFVIKAFGKRVYKYLQMIMIDQTGLNLRNNIAHGLIDFIACNKLMCTIIIHVLLIMTNYRLKVEEDTSVIKR